MNRAIKDEKWIQRAIKRKGSLHEAMHIPESKKIPMAALEKAAHSKSKLMRERANLAMTLKRMNRPG
jgi:uncharacterized FlgJ-related protein